jgi:predicted aconitase
MQVGEGDIMALKLSDAERDMLGGLQGPAVAMALRIVARTAEMLGAERLVPVASAHIDGCLYHGDSGTLFVERLVQEGGRVAVPTTLNVGSLDLLHAGRVRLPAHQAAMARRMMDGYAALGCRQSWTCAPYQAGHRPAPGQDVAWGESNAVAFCNSVLGARTNRYGDYLDICAALTARAPLTGLHLPRNRRATLHVDATGLPPALLREETLYPVLGAWLGRQAGEAVAAISGLPPTVSEDRLKALGAAAASSGSVGLFHVVGRTPEAPDLAAACQGLPPEHTIRLTPGMLDAVRRTLSTGQVAPGDPLGGVALGSPHFSQAEVERLLHHLAGRRCAIPLYVCTGRHVVRALETAGLLEPLGAAGVTLVADTCIVVTPILPEATGVIMTNSGKFAHYTRPNTGWDVLFASLPDCVESAVSGRVCRDDALWR